MTRFWSFLVALVVVLVIVADSALFTVDQTEQVLITQFGRPVRLITDPGLHVKVPFVQTVISFDRRLLNLELPGQEVILGDQRRLIVDSFTMFRIADPLQFYRAVRTEEAARSRLREIVNNATRKVLGNVMLPSVLSADRTHIMANLRQQVNSEMGSFGVAIVDVRIRRADLPEENTQAILSRMQSERQRVAAQARAEGVEAAQKIRAEAERDRTVLLAQARATADNTRGEGEAQASRIFAQAYGKDPNFFAAWRTLSAYRESFASGNAKLVLTPDNDFLRYLATRPVPAAP